MADEEQKKEEDLSKDSLDVLERKREIYKAKKELLQEQLEVSQDIFDVEKAMLDIRQNEAKLAKIDLEKHRKEVKILLEKKAIQGWLNDADKKQLDLHVSLKKEAEAVLNYLKQTSDVTENIADSFGSFLKLTLGVKKETDTIVGKLMLATQTEESALLLKTKLVRTAKQYLNATSLAEATLAKIFQSSMLLVREQEEALASFNRLTGAAGKYNEVLVDIERSNKQFGISTADAASAMGALYTDMASFTLENAETRKLLTETTAQLEKLGIDAVTSAQNLNIATRALGMNAAEAETLQRELLATAEALSLSPKTVAEGFAQAAPQLAQHGKAMVSVFKGLAEQSKKTGLAINDLLGITEKFNTFEGAADAAGNLNAVLGGDLINSVDLLMATEEERIKLLQQTIEHSGKQWHEMNRFEKIAVANAAGIQDMAKAAALFNPQMIGMTEAEKKSAIAKKELAERAKHVQTIFDQLKSIVMAFAISLEPVISKMKVVIDAILRFNDMTGGIMIPLVFGLTAAFVVLVKTLTIVSAIWGPLGSSSAAAGAGMKSAAGGVRSLARAASQGASGMLAFGAAVLLIGAGIGVAAMGMSQLVASFNGMQPEQIHAIAAAMGIFMLGLIGLTAVMIVGGVAASGAALGFLAVGAAMLMMGAAVAIAAWGLSSLVDSFAKLEPEQIFGLAAALGQFTVSITKMLVLAVVGPMIAGVLLAMGVAMLMIGSAVSNTAEKFAMFNQTLFNVNFDAVVSGYARIAQEINKIVESIEKMPLTKALTLSYLVSAPEAAGTTAVPTGAAAARTEATVNRVANAATRNAAVSREAARAAPAQNTGTTVRPNLIYKLVIDGKELGELIGPGIEPRISKVVEGKLQKVGRSSTPLE